MRQHIYELALRDFNLAWQESVQGHFRYSAAKALYGLCLTNMERNIVVGTGHVAEAADILSKLLPDALLADAGRSGIFSDTLYKAERFFQQGLINFPRISDYCIVEALLALIPRLQ